MVAGRCAGKVTTPGRQAGGGGWYVCVWGKGQAGRQVRWQVQSPDRIRPPTNPEQ